MANPDGTQFDLSQPELKWRKNRRNNGDGTFGVDLSRNFGFHWGESGADDETKSPLV